MQCHLRNHIQDCPYLPWNADTFSVSFPKVKHSKAGAFTLSYSIPTLLRFNFGQCSLSLNADVLGYTGVLWLFISKDPKQWWASWDCEGQECSIVPQQGWKVSGFDETQVQREENDAHFSRVILALSYPIPSFLLRHSYSVLCRGRSRSQLGKSIKQLCLGFSCWTQDKLTCCRDPGTWEKSYS